MTRLVVLVTFLAFAPPGLGISEPPGSHQGGPRIEWIEKGARAFQAMLGARLDHDHDTPRAP